MVLGRMKQTYGANKMDNSVKVPFSYFVKSAQNDYSYPREAFFREFLQNSADAGSKNIEFKIYDVDGKTFFECIDDGCGMTEDIIRNKLLTLGETSKGSNSTGGFGVAKILIYFAHLSYEIYTQDNIVKGSGGCYSIEKNNSYTNGTRSIVELNPKVFSLTYLPDYIEREIRKSYLPQINITVNGTTIPAETKRGRQVLDLGEIAIFKKNLAQDCGVQTTGYALVRVNGLHMFKIHCGEHKYQLVVELKTYSVNILTTNRDGFRSDWNSKVSEAIETICQDPSKTKTRSKTNFFKGKSTRVAPISEETLEKINQKLKENLTRGTDEETIFDTVKEEVEQTFVGLGATEQTTQINALRKLVKDQYNNFHTTGKTVDLTSWDLQKSLLYNVYIQTIGKYRTVPTAWQPFKFTDKQKNLLALWGKIVGMVLRDTGHGGVEFDAGYIFDDGTQDDITLAQYSALDIDGKTLHVFYLNPLKYGDQTYFPNAANRRTEMILWLMNLAIHEVTHYAGYSGHNYEFVAAESNLKLKVLKNIQGYLSL